MHTDYYRNIYSAEKTQNLAICHLLYTDPGVVLNSEAKTAAANDTPGPFYNSSYISARLMIILPLCAVMVLIMLNMLAFSHIHDLYRSLCDEHEGADH